MTMNSASITSDQERQYKRFVEDAARKGANLALEKVPLDKDGLQRVLEQGDKFGSAIANAIIAATRDLSTGAVGNKVALVEAPVNLADNLDWQVERLLDFNAHGQVHVAKGKYRDQLMVAVKAFSWREDLAAIGLKKVALVDFRLPGRFLAEAGGVWCSIEPEKCTIYGVAVPDGVLVIQGQWGRKYRNKAPNWCRANFHTLEQAGIVKEGLTAFLHEGKAMLEECYVDFPGSVSSSGFVPCLNLESDKPGLRIRFFSNDSATPDYGSFSRGN